MKQLRQRAIDGLAVGDEFVVTRTFTSEEIRQFAHLSRDYNPVHLDVPYAVCATSRLRFPTVY